MSHRLAAEMPKLAVASSWLMPPTVWQQLRGCLRVKNDARERPQSGGTTGKRQAVATNSTFASSGKCLEARESVALSLPAILLPYNCMFATNCVILFLFTFLFVYMCVCACVCVCRNKYIWKHIVVSGDKTTTFRYKRST